MKSKQRTAPNFLHKRQCKSKHFQTQMQRVFAALYRQPKTMLMVSIETGILRANICRYVAEWEKENRICIVRKGICPISKHRAGFYTTNPELFPSIVEPSNTVKL
jgi:hypothetical protein